MTNIGDDVKQKIDAVHTKLDDLHGKIDSLATVGSKNTGLPKTVMLIGGIAIILIVIAILANHGVDTPLN